MKKILTIKVIIIAVCITLLFTIVITIISAITGVSFGYDLANKQAVEQAGSSPVVNNQLYADRYRSLLNKYLVDKGYVSLERLVFYLQRTNNVLDVTTLSNEVWEDAYIQNLNEEYKQMVPIKTLCKEFKNDTTLPEYTVTDGTNENGTYINALNLCVVNDIDITTSDDYSENYSYLPYVFPLKSGFTVTSIVFENRDVDLNISEEEQARVNYHNGWDLAVPTGTDFYSICNGTVEKIVNTQFNDLPYNSSGNSVGNYVTVKCDNGLTALYYHIKANSVPFGIKVGSIVRTNQLLGKTSTTGMSTGPHLHLGLQDGSGKLLDAMEYIDFNYKE